MRPAIWPSPRIPFWSSLRQQQISRSVKLLALCLLPHRLQLLLMPPRQRSQLHPVGQQHLPAPLLQPLPPPPVPRRCPRKVLLPYPPPVLLQFLLQALRLCPLNPLHLRLQLRPPLPPLQQQRQVPAQQRLYLQVIAISGITLPSPTPSRSRQSTTGPAMTVALSRVKRRAAAP